MLFCYLPLVLAVICQTQGYTAPTLNCSSNPQGNAKIFGDEINDTFTTGDILFYTTENVSFNSASCSSMKILNITNGTAVSLNIPLASYCEEKIDCLFDCNGDSTKGLFVIATIKRTQEYSMSFVPASYTATIPENVKNGTFVELDTDLDVQVQNCTNGTNFSKFQRGYIVRQDDNNPVPFKWFAELNSNSLHLNGLIDFEQKQRYEVTIGAILKSAGNKHLKGTATTTVTVSIQDEDDNTPAFNITKTQTYKLSIPENNSSYVNTPLRTTPPVHAYDPDFGINANISYSILDQQEPGLFEIDSKTGEVTVTQKLDYEKRNYYTVYIKAFQDDKPDYATAQTRVEVTVIDQDDNSPEFIPGMYACSVSEHSAVGTVVCSVTAIDKDTKPEYSNFTYILWDNMSVFSVNNEGNILVDNSTILDRETQGDKITLQVGTKTLSGTYPGNATVTVQVLDINDNNPKFDKDKYSFNVTNTSDGSVLGQVSATDKDKGRNANITYTILPTVSSFLCDGNLPYGPLFNISKGEITIAADEVTFCKRYVLHVQACDNGTNRRCSFTVVEITLTESPKLKYVTQHVSVLEGLQGDTAVHIVKCSGYGHTYDYAGGPEFDIDNSTGMLMTRVILDRERIDSFNFEVNVTNNSGMILCLVNLTVSVEDANDHIPQFVNDSYKFILPSNLEDGDYLGTIKAVDEDIGENGNVSYYLNNQRFSQFELDEYSGNLSVNQSHLLNEDIMQVFVTAMDNGNPRLKVSTTVYIIGQTSENMVPISTPLTTKQVNEIKQELARDLTRILNIPVQISHVEEVQNKSSPYKSRLHITVAQSSTASKQSFLSQVLNHYEDIRSLFYKSSENTGTSGPTKSAFGASEIGLIVMAAVILIGAVLAIVLVHRQFNSHKKYKQLYETLTKNSSLYESQEITVDIGDGVSDCNGTVRSQDINGEDATSLTVSAVNPVYQSDNAATDLTQVERDISAGPKNETTDEGEVIQKFSESYEKEDNVSENINDQNDNEKDVHDYVNTSVVYAQAGMSSLQEGEASIDSSNNNDLINFDSESNGEKSEQSSNESEPKSPEIEVDEEPQPDYNAKQVRFHSEVLDADENKLEPLKVKNEEEANLEDSANAEESSTVDEALDEDKATGDMPVTGPDSDKNTDLGEIGSADTDRLEEEINSSEVTVPYIEQIQDEFYQGAMESTQF